jgi:hypothetical protein
MEDGPPEILRDAFFFRVFAIGGTADFFTRTLGKISLDGQVARKKRRVLAAAPDLEFVLSLYVCSSVICSLIVCLFRELLSTVTCILVPLQKSTLLPFCSRTGIMGGRRGNPVARPFLCSDLSNQQNQSIV